MTVLTHRVVPKEAKAVRADLSAIAKQVRLGAPLSLGDQGGAVSALQRELTSAGLYTGPVTGTFDAATEAAVQALQRAKKLAPSGTVEARTLAAVKSTDLFVKDGFRSPAHVGQSGGDIRHAEALLQKMGFNPGAADGVFDQQTAQAVARFRKAQPAVPDQGTALTANVYQHLATAARGYDHAAYSKREIGHVKQQAALNAATAAAASHGLTVGAHGRDVSNIERHLEAAGFELGKPDAVFGARTAAATRAFQKASGLAQTGVVDQGTWAKLKNSLFAATSATSPAQRVGERDGSVKKVENQLKQLGLKPGAADGLFTANTQKAVKKFQQRHHLTATGTVNTGTEKAIAHAIKAKASGAGKRAVQIAAKFVGFHEHGTNGNPFSAYFKRPAEAWCADFVSYCFEKAGHPIGKKGVGFAYVPSLESYLKSQGKWHSQPKPGAVVIFGGGSHTGIVSSVSGGYVHTIEGNSSDGVYRRSYPIGSSYLTGYGYW